MHSTQVQSLLDQGVLPLLAALKEAKVPMCYQRAIRCVRSGIRGIRLPAIRIAGRWHTSPAAIKDWVAQTTAKALGEHAAPKPAPTGTGARYLRSLGLDQASLHSSRSSLGQPPATPSPPDLPPTPNRPIPSPTRKEHTQQ
jgi:hypothetical protein